MGPRDRPIDSIVLRSLIVLIRVPWLRSTEDIAVEHLSRDVLARCGPLRDTRR